MKAILRRHSKDLLALTGLLLLPLLLFWPVTVGGKTLIPADNLFQWLPWREYAAQVAAETPHNELLSDLLLENYVWKQFIRQSIAERQIPLWHPYIFGGAPFLAAGQHSALYPFSIIYLIFPLTRAYGIFTISQLFLAGAFMYLFGRVLGLRRPGAMLAGITFQLCGFMLVSVDFPMILAGAAWLPFLLAMVELVVRQQPALGGRPATLPWVVLGAAGLGMQLLAGHGENSYFTLLVMGLYAAWRLAVILVSERAMHGRPLRRRLAAVLKPAFWIVVMALLGLGLGAVQIIPFVELVRHNFREGAASLADLLSWSYPWRRLIAFVAPNFFGNPSHHGYFDLFSWGYRPVTVNALGDPIFKIDWGIKNYVEGGAYLGILPLLLALTAVLSSLRRRAGRPAAWFFALLSLASLSFIFRTGTYAILHAIPIINQSHSPFRWVFPLSLSVAILAGFGADLAARPSRWRSALAGLTMAGGAAGVIGLVLGRLFFDCLEPTIEKIFLGLAKAPEAFPDVRAFFSYEARQLLVAALVALAAGTVLWLAQRRVAVRGRPVWMPLALALVAVDLAVATWGFNPAADPQLLDVKPELIEFLEGQFWDSPSCNGICLWRVTTFTPHGDTPLHANTPWLYGLHDVRGYDSIILKQYVQYMEAIEPQGELLYNRVQPIKNWESLNSPLLDALNVKYVVTSERLEMPKMRLAWEGEGLRVYENLAAAPRAFTLPAEATVIAPDALVALGQFDPRHYVVVAQADAPVSLLSSPPAEPMPSSFTEEPIRQYGSQEVVVAVHADRPEWLVLADTYFPGWKAYIRPLQDPEADEQEVQVVRVNGNFRGVQIAPGLWSVRFKYSPMSFKFGLFVSFMAAVIICFVGGIWLWRFAYRESDDASTVRRVAKNSLAPMALNLFNRGIDFAYAALYLRILGAGDAGKFYVAMNVAMWFEIFANFGLNTLLTREVAKDRGAANRYLVNTTVLRFFTGLGAAVPIALYVWFARSGPDPLAADTIWAILLLIIGMIPSGISSGLTALFYVYEKAEVPAALTTVSTILKVTLGTAALLAGLGFLGMAGVSIAVSLITMLVLGVLAFRAFFVPNWELDWPLQRGMVRESYPLMLNHLLATIYFQVDVLLLERLAGTAEVTGNTVVGWYSTAYKWVLALNIIPSFFTMAIFPVISRQAEDAQRAMLDTYKLATKLLVMLALPLSVATTWVAPFLIQVLGGAEYMPHGARALQLMIWHMPLGWINSITNYLLIALGEQRRLTRAFVVGVSFNVVCNVILIPEYGYPASAVITILSELVLLVAFYYYLRRALAPIPWLPMLWRPALAAAAMGVVTWLGWSLYWALGLAAGVVVYAALLVLLRPLSPQERQVLAELLPERFRRFAHRPI